MSFKEEKILIAGFGGQGIMFLGKILALSAVQEGKRVTFIRSYGAEMRGGTANCMLRISNREIASPVFEKATLVFIMNQPSWEKFKKKIEEGGFIFLNSSLVKKEIRRNKIKVRKVPLNELALKAGSLKIANIVGLGFLLKEAPIVKLKTVREVLKNTFKNNSQLLKLNLTALNLGFNYESKD
ncbi:MAG: 2-oxoacid:acceptor oxidoreductase family protein [Candidatus Omnitrophica bacterium]|nr:2-oxoacid:acceptor oxidoreductase family protein [Candidatus Omnitrophota bacterium]